MTTNYDHELQQSTDNRYSTTAGILSNFYPERKENIYGHLNGRLLTLSIYFLRKKATENLKLSDRKFECNTFKDDLSSVVGLTFTISEMSRFIFVKIFSGAVPSYS